MQIHQARKKRIRNPQNPHGRTALAFSHWRRRQPLLIARKNHDNDRNRQNKMARNGGPADGSPSD